MRFPDTRPSLLTSLSNGPDGQVAWREFFERYAPAIYRVARIRGLSDDDADDLVQQTMISILSHIGDFEYNRCRGQFRNWVRTIAENKIKENARKRKPPMASGKSLADCDDDGPSLDEIWEEEWRLQDMLWSIDQVAKDVSPRRMEAFRQYALGGVPAETVAKNTEMTVGHVYVTRHLVLNKIRQKIAELNRTEHSDGDLPAMGNLE